MVRSMPALSWRNYVGLSLRGPEAVNKRGRHEGFGWGPAFVASRQAGDHGPPPAFSEAELVRRRLLESSTRPDRHARGRRLLGDPSDPPDAARPLRADLPGRHRRRGRGGLPSGPELPRAVRRSRRHQRLDPRRLPPPGPAQGVPRAPYPGRPRRVECPCPGPLPPAAMSPRSAPAASESRSSPTPVPTASPHPCLRTSIPG